MVFDLIQYFLDILLVIHKFSSSFNSPLKGFRCYSSAFRFRSYYSRFQVDLVLSKVIPVVLILAPVPKKHYWEHAGVETNLKLLET